MKTKLFDILVEKILQCMFLLIVFVNVSYSQNTSPKEKEILAYITDGILTLPALEHEQLTIDKIKIHSIAFTKGLEKAKVKTLRKAFPEFSPSDSIRITPAGKKYSIVHFSHIFRLKINDDGDLDSAKSILSKIPGVLFAEKNMDAHLFSDTTYANQWHLNNTGQSGGLSGADIKAELAWAIFTGNPSIIIGIIDSGVETTHEDLSGKATGDLPAGAEYHGTHVAGIAAAKANNDKGGRGVDWNAQILSRRIFDAYGNYLGDVTAANQTISAVDNGAHILNHSWGGPSYSSTIRMAFSYAYEMNRTSIVAMGNNNGSQIQYPAGYGQGIIAVGSTRDDDTWSSFSDIGNHIDVAAPGGINPYPDNDKHDIWSTWGNNSYRYLAGTSMAAPVVSGIASLLKGYNTSLYNDDIEHIIQLSADDVNSSSFPAWDQYLGYGRVNARKALDLLRSPYVLEQASVTGGADVGSTGYYQTVIYGAPGLVPDVYLVKRHEVQRTVYYNNKQEVNVWGRGVASNGWSIESPNYSMGWCDAVPGTVTSTSATLQLFCCLHFL